MGKTLKQKKDEAEKEGIHIPADLLGDKNIVGIYGFFAIEKDEEHCFYIGKSTNIAYRLLGSSDGHVYLYLKKAYSKLVPQKINEYRNDKYEIEVRVLDTIDYHDTSFSKAAHRLALAELQRIVLYQEQGQCEFQIPEGSGTYERKYWEKHYKNSDVNKD